MNKKENDVPIRKSDRIAAIIAKANQVAAIDWLQAILEEQAEPIRRELHGLQALTAASEPQSVVHVKAIEAPRAIRARKSVKGYWARMTPEERSAEMKRRVAKQARTKRGQPKGEPKLTLAERLKLHPRDKRSPRHDDWLKMMSTVQQRRFDSMTVREKKQWKTAMLEGRERSREQRVNGVIQ